MTGDRNSNEEYLNTVHGESTQPLDEEISRGNTELDGQPLMSSDIEKARREAAHGHENIPQKIVRVIHEILADLEGEDIQ